MSEAVILLSMVAIFALLAMVLKLPIGVSLVFSALSGALLGGEGIALRHLVEGSFGYFDTILIIVSAMIFMKALQASGILDTITAILLKTFYKRTGTKVDIQREIFEDRVISHLLQMILKSWKKPKSGGEKDILLGWYNEAVNKILFLL